jgi:hypothetical protein
MLHQWTIVNLVNCQQSKQDFEKQAKTKFTCKLDRNWDENQVLARQPVPRKGEEVGGGQREGCTCTTESIVGERALSRRDGKQSENT